MRLSTVGLLVSLLVGAACSPLPVETRDAGGGTSRVDGGAGGAAGGAGGVAGSGGAGGESSDGGCTACGASCVDLRSDDANCGACGRACGAGEACSGSACRPRDCALTDCGPGQVCVGDACQYARCGAMTCATGTVCHDGRCVPETCVEPACGPGLACVDGQCVDSACQGVTCPFGGACVGGRCVGADAGRIDSGVVDAGMVDAGRPDAGSGPCLGLAEGAACGPVTACRGQRCRGGACLTETVADGTRCADAGVCQPAGLCQAGTCNQPPPTACLTGDIQVSLTWDTHGLDLELHLIRPGGRINDTTNRTDCTWNTCVSSQPDWGAVGVAADNPRKDVDNTGTLGPENIALNGPESGTYAVLVEHWGSGTPSTAQVVLQVRGVSRTFNVSGLPSHWVWDVARIDGATGAITGVGSTRDCTASWSGGCTLMLP